MKHFVKLFFMVLTVTIGGLAGHSVVSAQELSSTDFIDSISFTNTNLQQGQSSSVRVSFSEKNNLDVKPGDTITLSLPPELKGMTESDGSPRKIQLSDLGEALVYSDRVVATFNDKVKKLNHVTGTFNFGLTATRTDRTKDSVIHTNLGTTVNTQSITIKGNSNTNTGPSKYPFFWKSGDMNGSKNAVRWFLNVNMNKLEMASDVSLTDTHGPGQKFDKNNINVTVDNYLGRTQITAAEFEKKGYGTITISSDNKMIIHIRRECVRLASFSFSYETLITNNRLKAFDNSCDITYQLWGGKPLLETSSYNVTNLFSDGEASGNLETHEPVKEQEIKQPIETVDPIDSPKIKPEIPKTDVEKNEVTDPKDVKLTQPVIKVDETENSFDEESITDIETIKPEIPKTDVEKNEVTDPKDVKPTQPEIKVDETETSFEEESITDIETVKPETPKTDVEKDEVTDPKDVKPTQPVIKVDETENSFDEESITDIETVKPETPKTDVEKNEVTDPKDVKPTQPEIKVDKTENSFEEESITDIETIKPETPKTDVEKDEVTDPKDVKPTQPVIKVDETENSFDEESITDIETVKP
ncbi:collagen binding domain-containing protein, partial [Vagococcus hydrophili]